MKIRIAIVAILILHLVNSKRIDYREIRIPIIEPWRVKIL